MSASIKTGPSAKLAALTPAQTEALHAWLAAGGPDSSYKTVKARLAREFGVSVSVSNLCSYWRKQNAQTIAEEKQQSARLTKAQVESIRAGMVVKVLRVLKGVSAEELAKRARISVRELQLLETGESVSSALLGSVAREVGADLAWIVRLTHRSEDVSPDPSGVLPE